MLRVNINIQLVTMKMLWLLFIVMHMVLPSVNAADSPVHQEPLGRGRMDATSASWKAHHPGLKEFVSLSDANHFVRPADAYGRARL